MKKILCTILCLILVLTMIPMVAGGAFAENDPAPETPDYLCFTATQAGSTVKLIEEGSPNDISLVFSTDKVNWETYTISNTVTLTNAGDKVYFRASGTNSTFSQSASDYYKFTMSGKIAASGNIMSLLDSSCTLKEIPYMYCFRRLFDGCSALISAPELPATTLTDWCYYGMFEGCISLTAAPKLPATTLKNKCYYAMFTSCESLVETPELPVTTLAEGCYQFMFWKCKSLTAGPELPATTLAKNCYDHMFRECVSLTDAPKLPATTLAAKCYEGMFAECSNLTTAYIAATNTDDTNSEYMFLRANSVEIIVPSGNEYGFYDEGNGEDKEKKITKINKENHKSTVKFYVDDVVFGSSTNVGFFECIAAPTTPTKPGNKFLNWSTEQNRNNKFAFSTPIVTNTNLYAMFEHAHEWAYSTSSDATSLTASCAYFIDNSTCAPVTVTLKADSVEFDGSAHGAYLENYNVFNTNTGLSTTTNITYYLEDGETPTSVSNNGALNAGQAPVKAGKYVAKVTLGGVYNLEKSFEIKAKPSNPTSPGYYYVPTVDKAKETKEMEEKSALKEKIATADISMKSSQTKLNGHTAIKVTWVIKGGDLKLTDLDNYQIYRSTKKNSGYGKKPYFTSSKPDYGYYVNNKGLKKGQTYYFKVRGFKVIDGTTYYTPWSTKCWRTVK